MWSICKEHFLALARSSSSSEPGTCKCVRVHGTHASVRRAHTGTRATRTLLHVDTCLTGPRVETHATHYPQETKKDNYPGKSRGISPDNELTFKWHSSSSSRIIDLLFNKLTQTAHAIPKIWGVQAHVPYFAWPLRCTQER